MLDHPLPDLESWLLLFRNNELPVLRHTARQLQAARERIDHVSGRDVSRIVLQDPLMTVKVLAYIQPFRGSKLRSDITTIGSAVMMLGIEPFFAQFEELITVESMLHDEPQALLGVLQVIRRVQRASQYAQEWALWRHDLNIDEVVIATLLHDLAEILMWCYAPRLAIDIRDRLRTHPGRRSAKVQTDVLGITLNELQLELCRVWHLPGLLHDLIDEAHAEHPRVRNVVLAVSLARHSANGWNDPALPDDLSAIGKLLNLSLEPLLERMGVTEEQRLQIPRPAEAAAAGTPAADAAKPD